MPKKTVKQEKTSFTRVEAMAMEKLGMVYYNQASIEPRWIAQSGNSSYGRYAKKISTRFVNGSNAGVNVSGAISKYEALADGLPRILDDRVIKLTRYGSYNDGRAGSFRYEIDLTPSDVKSIFNHAILNDIQILSPLLQRLLQLAIKRKMLRSEVVELITEVTEMTTDEVFKFELKDDVNFKQNDQYKKTYEIIYSEIENEFEYIKKQTPFYLNKQVDKEAETLRNKMFSSLTEEDVEIEI
jgi:hypothetical protein